ncbi:MAG: DUF982 domain-containing protein [Hyphomicrobiales bacterium]|nr:MAG: DUF982 domain-containing protein [Hyphomicrobiales bacterium]
MSRGKFHKPVIVQPGRIDRDRIVLSTRDAALVLLRDWPHDKAQERREEAMKACLAVIKGKKPPSYARKAFVIAAKDARILIHDGAESS